MGRVIHGLLLAAGAGTRMGTPKALVPGWLAGAVDVLRDGGCVDVTVVLGAAADEARNLLPAGVHHVVAEDWERGMSRSLSAGLVALAGTDATAALLHQVDLPDVGAEVVRRVVAAGDGSDVLARATYDSRPGHPVLIGREHWSGVVESAAGDEGARGYLRRHGAAAVECGDLATGRDVDSR
jgi:CTP:molybdopterin cytidylyltransferase MocA